MAVYGSRNPHRFTDLLTPDTPLVASELYGCHKLEAENIVRTSDLEWSILRLGGVMTLEPLVDYGDVDSFYFGALCPQTTGSTPSTPAMSPRHSRRRSPRTSSVRCS